MPYRQQAYASLNDLLQWNSEGARRLRVAIVTPDIMGPVRNGGIGTACAYLVKALARAGHDVHVLFSQSGAKGQKDAEWCKHYTDKGISVTIAEAWDAKRASQAFFPNHQPLRMAHVTHDWLAAQPNVDLALFMEWQGHGFYALQAKACGLRFQTTALIVVVHSPSIWHSCNNASLSDNPIDSCIWHMERRCVEMADAVISPSAYMLDWCFAHHFKLPRHVFVQPNLLDLDKAYSHDSEAPIEEVVFFGRLEYRKGLEQFCSALDILAKRAQLPKRISFVGKCALMGEKHALLYLARRAEAWKGSSLALRLHYDQHQALNYLCGRGRLAVMPSVADNSPYTVYECLLSGIPFLARDTGGTAELIEPGDRPLLLFGDNPGDLAARLHTTLGKAPLRGRLAFAPQDNRKAWCAGLPKLAELIRHEQRAPRPALRASVSPFISVCLTHYNRPNFLRQAVDSLLAQDYQHFEVILADDGSTDEKALKLLDELEPLFLRKGWRILRLENGYPAKARNSAARLARGEWLLFFDDDNIAMPHMLRRFACAASKSGAGLIAAMFDVFEGEGAPGPAERKERFLPTGDAVAYSSISNTLADTSSLIRCDAFARVGGFREDYGLGHEDFELFVRMALTGEAVTIVPESLYWYRRAKEKTSVQRDSNAAANRMRSLRPFLELWPAPAGELAFMAHGMAKAQGLYARPAGNEAPALRVQGDPQSESVLAQVASALEQDGHRRFAIQILESLDNASPLTAMPIVRLNTRARKAAAAGHEAQVRGYLEDLAKLSPEPADYAACCLAVLRDLPSDKKLRHLRNEVMQRLKAVGDERLATHLAIAGHSFASGDTDQAVIFFFKALALAEQEYLDARQDVAKAIREGSFFCALQHYAAHGLADKTPWPDKHHFSRILKERPQLLPILCAAHMAAYHYTDALLAKKNMRSLRENL